jgi:cytochrome c-type biogenesis protein CcmH
MPRRTFIRAAQASLIAILIVAGLGASDSAVRFDKDSHSIMCVCGCNQLLGECNHVGCPALEAENTLLAASIAKGESDNTIFHEFQDQYGPVALASPMFTRFNHFAWILPPLMLFLGIAGTLLIVRKWRLRTVPMPSTARTPGEEAVRNRIRSETQL